MAEMLVPRGRERISARLSEEGGEWEADDPDLERLLRLRHPRAHTVAGNPGAIAFNTAARELKAEVVSPYESRPLPLGAIP
jgi:hypothetical protein